MWLLVAGQDVIRMNETWCAGSPVTWHVQESETGELQEKKRVGKRGERDV